MDRNSLHKPLIDAGQASTKVSTGIGFTPTKLYVPDGFAGTSVSFEMAEAKEGHFGALNDREGNAITYAVSGGNWYNLSPSDFAGVEHLFVVSNAVESASELLLIVSRLD